LACYVAEWSPDPKTRVGAVILDQYNHVRSVDCNHFPSGVNETPERLNNKEEKLKYIAHAERNALDICDTNVRGGTAYITLQPCYECAKSLIQRGITRVVTGIDVNKQKYYGDFVNYSLPMMTESGIKVVQVQL
jgi:dCMP deaminase